VIGLPVTLTNRWASGKHIGPARPAMQVHVRRGYLQRYRRDDGVWTADWTPSSDWQLLPGVNRCELEQTFDDNGITTCTIEMANIAYPIVHGVAGDYHRTERGWFSPFRSYTGGGVPGLGVPPNEWETTLATAAQVEVTQGYGDRMVTTFTGLLDSVTADAMPAHLTLVARDFGQLLTDCHLFGWNIDPHMRDPIHFTAEKLVRELETSDDAADRDLAEDQRKRWIVLKDLADAVTTILTWGGLQKYTVKKVGTSIDEATAFAAGDYLIDVIKKAQDVCGYTFFIGEPRSGFPLGEPIFRRSNAATVPPPALELRDDQLLTGLNWQRTDEPLAGIIRVRGKPQTKKRGGELLGGESGGGVRRVMAVYRPPWHRAERDARLIRHVVHIEPLYKTELDCMVAAKMIALQEALAATTATVVIPAHPGIQLDDILSIRDHATGVASRVWVASKQSTFEAGAKTGWTQSLGVALLDTPDVVGVIKDLHTTLVAA
jgi:hypothetical protein